LHVEGKGKVTFVRVEDIQGE